MPWSPRNGTRVSSGLIARQIQELEESFAADAETQASDSEPEAHVMEPLADDHSSDSDDAPTGIEEVFVVTLFLNSLTMCAAVSEEAASDILVGAQPRIRCWARARYSSSELVDTATAWDCSSHSAKNDEAEEHQHRHEVA